MKTIEQVLDEIRKDTPFGPNDVSVFVVVNPAGEEPKVERQVLTEEMLSKTGNRNIVDYLLEHLTLSALEKWRGP